MVGFGPISSLPVSALPRSTWLSNTTVYGRALLEARLLTPQAEIIGDPRNQLVVAVKIDILTFQE